MANLSLCLRYYIADRLNNDPGWKNIQVTYKLGCISGSLCFIICAKVIVSLFISLEIENILLYVVFTHFNNFIVNSS